MPTDGMGLPWWGWVVLLTALLMGLLAVVARGLAGLGARRWAVATQVLTAQLDAAQPHPAAPPASALRYDPRELDGLPAPVARYFSAVLRPGQPIITAVAIDLAGRFNLSATGSRWVPFTSTQQVRMQRPGFVWDARMVIGPGVPVRAVDSYVAGRGRLRAAIAGLVTLAEQPVGSGPDEAMDRGELIRWFAEAPWYPTALLPSQGVRWSAVDARSADATIVDGQLTLTLRFHFDDDGLIVAAHADARAATVDKQVVMLPWEGRWRSYQQHDGMLVPLSGEAAWLHPGGRRPYFTGNVTSMVFRHAP